MQLKEWEKTFNVFFLSSTLHSVIQNVIAWWACFVFKGDKENEEIDKFIRKMFISITPPPINTTKYSLTLEKITLGIIKISLHTYIHTQA